MAVRYHKPKEDSILVVNVQLMQNPSGRKETRGGKRSKANYNGYDWIGSTNYVSAGWTECVLNCGRLRYLTILEMGQFNNNTDKSSAQLNVLKL